MHKTVENNGLYQNLLDAGCSAETADRCKKLADSSDWHKLLRELAEHKKHLLASLHKSEKQIDCLDFLVYDINKKHKGEF